MSPTVIEPVAGARPVVQLGVGDSRAPSGSARWDVSRWDGTHTWAGFEPDWFDISCYVHDIEIAVGRDRSMQRWEVGSCGLTVDNSDGWADMGQGAPPEPFLLTVRPGRQLRVGMSLDDGPTRWMWRGFIDSAEPSYDAEHHDIVTLACIDAKGEAGKVDLGRVDPAVGAGETATTRIGRILDAATWPGARDVAPSSVTLLATDLGARAGDLLDVSAESAGGAVLGDARGYVVFKPRDWQTFDPSTPPDASIGNVSIIEDVDIVFYDNPVVFNGDQLVFGEAASGDVCPTTWERLFARVDIATRSIIGRPGEATRQFDDEPNQILYGIETVARTDIIAAEDGQLDVLGRRWLKVLSADYMPRVAAVTIDPASSVAARNLAATVDPTVPSRYRCRHHRSDGRIVFDSEFFATGVRHTISREDWICRIALDEAAPYGAIGGRWDVGRWDLAVWGELV